MATLVGAPPVPPGRITAALEEFRVRAALVAACAWLVLYAVLTVLARTSAAQNFVSDVVYLVPVALAACLSLAACARTRGRRRLFWSILAASNTLWLAGEAVWSVYELVLGRPSPFPSIADVFYLSSYALVPAAILGGWATGSVRGALRRLVDSSVIVAAVGLMAWSLLIGPQLAWGLSLATATGIAYPLLGVAILVLIGSVGLTGLRRAPFSIVLVAAAFAISALTDAAYTYLVVVHDFVAGRWLNIGWQAEAVLLSVAALAAAGAEPEQANDDRRDHGLLLVLIGGVASVAIVAVDSYNGNLSRASLGLGAYATGAVLVRLYLTSRENTRLARGIEASLAAEEDLVSTLRERNERLAEQASVLEATLAERERSEAERRTLEERLRQSQKLDTFGKLAGGVSHEFETMLATMTQSASSLVATVEGDALQNAERIKVAADRAAAMMEQLLAFGREQVLRPQRVDLNGFGEEISALLRPLLDPDLDVVTEAASDPCDIQVDPAKLEQLVVNLALNARDAGARVLTIAASTADLHSDSSRWGLDLPRGRYACLTVSDDGGGMEDATRSRIFEPFFSTKPAGLGLGLATLHGTVRQSGGDVRVESRPGAGARFELFFPLA